ncbi:SDR family NAD(P)-dependent oxidoreductase [Corynebacterium poyangense]|uniref:SDR family NAD(P)-dependent oxidoreductase n=1 Tax=Corynebacterium poyangense TaxID=2684405 RepID=A0A7H0SLA6_9CORY|nr:SDR family oxidoreductase [Corynebacterium poyangense]QNQ89331.1 SDR family NAD(P)-dependent oxidoreductase [Corynebacterium poyangense]
MTLIPDDTSATPNPTSSAADTGSNSASCRVAVVTGGSSGIGEAAARALAQDGWQVIIAARREDRLAKIAEEIGATAITLDVTDDKSVAHFAQRIPAVDLLVNNAGGAKGLEPVEETTLQDWQWMYDTNVLGTVRVTQALLPQLREARGLIINIGSVAALRPYEGGSGYNAAKFGLRALTRVLRIENAEREVRVCEIDPGRVATDFSLVRFSGNQDRADAVYADKINLLAEDIAEAIRWVASLPPRVNIDSLNIMPADQI